MTDLLSPLSKEMVCRESVSDLMRLPGICWPKLAITPVLPSRFRWVIFQAWIILYENFTGRRSSHGARRIGGIIGHGAGLYHHPGGRRQPCAAIFTATALRCVFNGY